MLNKTPSKIILTGEIFTGCEGEIFTGCKGGLWRYGGEIFTGCLMVFRNKYSPDIIKAITIMKLLGLSHSLLPQAKMSKPRQGFWTFSRNTHLLKTKKKDITMTIDYELLARRVAKWMKRHPKAYILSDWTSGTDDVWMLLRSLQKHYRRGLTRHDVITALRLAAFRGWLKYER